MSTTDLHPHARVIRRATSESDWHELRRMGIGGSDASVLLGHSRFKSVEQLVDLKRGLAQPDGAGPLARFGTLMEEVILQAVEGAEPGDHLGTLQSLAHPHLLANLDGTLVRNGERWLVEVKTSGAGKWRGRVPAYYVDQVQHYLLVTGLRHALVVCCECPLERETCAQLIDEAGASREAILGLCKIRTYEIHADPAWQAEYIPVARAFWDRVQGVQMTSQDAYISPF